MVDASSEASAAALRAVLSTLLCGLALLVAVVVYAHARATGLTPSAERVRADNGLTMVAMAVAAALVVVSEAFWRGIIRGGGRVKKAFIVRAALREAAAMSGLFAALVCARHGVLRLYPAYWANLAPLGLFVVFAKLHWPTAAGLDAEVAEILPK